ncbi:MAG: DUF4124 domain-containing protein [Betaproteobacteria bacterium]
MTRLWPTLLALCLLPAAQATTIVRCELNGRVTYQNTPCPAKAQSHEVEAANVPLPPVDIAAVEARRAAFLEERQRAAAAARDAELARLADTQTELARAQQRQAAALDAMADQLADQPTVVYGGYGGYGGYPQGKWNRPVPPKQKPDTGRPDAGYDRHRDRGNTASAIDRAVQRAVAQRVERDILGPAPGGRR